MAHYKVILAYDGTDFAGFQRQKDTVTVQGEIEDALRELGWDEKSIQGAGRTDAGVHAQGQVIAFNFSWGHPDEDLQNALNAKLPASISTRRIFQVPPDFHPRYDASYRRYRYSIIQDPVKNPLSERYAWRVRKEINLELMRSAAAALIGLHDFSGFGSPHSVGGSTRREVHHVSWTRDKRRFEFEITANAFLYHMVRRIVHALIEVGHGRHTPDELQESINFPAPNRITGLAPPQGLCLMEVGYPD